MPLTELAPGALIESVVTKGDLAKLSPQERTQYYIEVCRSVGLNPFTRPLEYIPLNGKLVLYARRDAADQLRKLNGISVDIVSRDVEDDLVVVHVRARDKTGRSDEDFGAVSITGLRGEAKANAVLKAITKAKRRVTLSIAGLGFLDETEVDDIPATDKTPTVSAVLLAAELDAFAPESGTEPDQAETDDLLTTARAEALKGHDGFRRWYLHDIDDDQRTALRPHIKALQETARLGEPQSPGNVSPPEPPELTPRPEADPAPPGEAPRRRRKPRAAEPSDAEIEAVLGPEDLDPAPIAELPDYEPADVPPVSVLVPFDAAGNVQEWFSRARQRLRDMHQADAPPDRYTAFRKANYGPLLALQKEFSSYARELEASIREGE